MAYGDGPDDQALRAAWRGFCEGLELAGEQAFKDLNPAASMYRVDALRFLTQNLGQAFDLALETRDTRYPQLHYFCSPTRKLGSDAADFIYQQAWIDGESEYRIRGHLGSVRFLNFTIQGARPSHQPGSDVPTLHEPFGDIPEANLFGHDLIADAQGYFELYIGGAERPANWLPTTPQSRKLFIRQGFDRWDETPASLAIERVDMNTPKPLPGAKQLIDAMAWASDFVQGLMRDWPDHPNRFSPFVDAEHPNAFPPDPSANTRSDDRKRGRAIAHLCWALEADEALIIEFDAHTGFWMLSNMGVFMNSMDFRYRPVSYTPSRSVVDEDGKHRFVLCAVDPGVHNWIDTQGFERGNLTYRNLLGAHPTQFQTRLVPRQQLLEFLPATTCIVSSEQREAQLWTRFRAIQRRFAGAF